MKIVFCHGKESGPWGTKITYLADLASKHSEDVTSIDFRASLDPEWRVDHLLSTLQASSHSETLIVGSSMGAYVANQVACVLPVKGVFLLAPAFYLPGYAEQNPQAPTCPVSIVHGWKDDVVPYSHAVRYAEYHQCELHLIDSDHGLNDSLPVVGDLFNQFVKRLND